MDDWLSDRSAVEKAIVAAIRCAIGAHGPVTRENASSAAKRVYGELKALRRRLTDRKGEDK